MLINGDTFECGCDMFDVTSLRRPDTSWSFTDAKGHEHRWHKDGAPAKDYRPTDTYDTPTLVWVKDGEEWWSDDDKPHDVGHLECVQCGEHVMPRYTADDNRQYIPGSRWFRINGESVSEQEFMARLPQSP